MEANCHLMVNTVNNKKINKLKGGYDERKCYENTRGWTVW